MIDIKKSTLWTKEILRSTAKSTNFPDIGVGKTHKSKPPFYKGRMPLKYDVHCKMIMFSLFPAGLSFNKEWIMLFLYRDKNSFIQRNPCGAIVADTKTSTIILAEAKVISSSGGQLQIKEVHYLNNKTIFSATSIVSARSGFKTKETEVIGKKMQEYFFIWPIGQFKDV